MTSNSDPAASDPTASEAVASGVPALESLARPSGGFVMVAMDQRESLRQMFRAATGERVGDERLTSFKLAVAREVGPYASGFLIDRDYGFGRVAAEGVVSGGLIVAVDALRQDPDGPVEDTAIDERVDLAAAREAGAVAAKLLVIWRDDEHRARRLETAAEFVRRCAAAGLLSVLEGVARPPPPPPARTSFLVSRVSTRLPRSERRRRSWPSCGLISTRLRCRSAGQHRRSGWSRSARAWTR
ncbi:hypothetical protein [Nonomuraea candida]|uniref:hypothetical protein n=1 Tax=Nonomuraea candida TaxID=359159 RepID=UPI000AD6F278|nr:hypothetical protein [Nonomuraea candida]